jgi:hypothetical protein
MPISTGFRTLKRDPKNSQGKLADLDGLSNVPQGPMVGV